MRTERIDYSSFALIGLDTKIKEVIPLRSSFLAVACHRGVRRSQAATRILMGAGCPVANNPSANPSINYADFTGYNFTLVDEGIVVPGKTDYPFHHLLLFHDGGSEEEACVHAIRQILRVEARGILQTLVLAEVRDEQSLMGIA